MPATAVLVTSEHGGNDVPSAYRGLFRGARRVLDSHRGWDPGSLPLAEALAAQLSAPLRSATVTRLLVDLNRSAHHPRVFSEFTRALPRGERGDLLAAYHTPHRTRVADDVAGMMDRAGCVVHLGIHTFTPVMNGKARRPDIGLLYDPGCEEERMLCAAWADALRAAFPGLAIRRNDPYRGVADGLTTWLRKRFPSGRYLGIEVEVNQRLLQRGNRFGAEVETALARTFGEARGVLG